MRYVEVSITGKLVHITRRKTRNSLLVVDDPSRTLRAGLTIATRYGYTLTVEESNTQ